ncbi:PilZ domain-containing protein [Eionea flava]
MTTEHLSTDRQFIRHPSNIPLEYCVTNEPSCNTDIVCNISEGGLSFHSHEYIAPDKWLHLYIPLSENYFETDAQVRWCERSIAHSSNDEHYHVGVSFCGSELAFSARMVEQVCHIEEYKQRVNEKEGRALNSDQAAAEWIEKYADTFPSFHH